MKKFALFFVALVFVGCLLDNEETHKQQYINSTSQICRDFSACDTAEASIVYSLTFEGGQTIEVSRSVYSLCGSAEYYPECLKEVE